MPNIKFMALYLLSQSERRALKVPLNASRIVIQGGNGFGKSAIIKSIYDTMGASPLKIDRGWKRASVSSALIFEYKGERYTAVKALDRYALFDSERRLIFSGEQVVRDWAPLLAEFFDFRLIMSDRDGEIAVPPPSYMFAPFYIDQDSGWNRPWSSFTDLYLPDSPRTLADYHSGIRPDAYYSAKAKLALDRMALSSAEAGVATLREAISQVQQIEQGDTPTYDLQEFKSEIDDLIQESELLLNEQAEYRRQISNLHEEAHLLRSEKTLLEGVVRELREDFDAAVNLPDEVECPVCGQGYANKLADRFALIQDEGVLTQAIGQTSAKLNGVLRTEHEKQGKLSEISNRLFRIERILAVERAALSFGDVVIGAGKTEAAKLLRSSLGEKAANADGIRQRVREHQATMATLTATKRTSEILTYYRSMLAENALELDVILEGDRAQLIHTIQAARGSQGPRGLVAYFYAFLQTRAKFTEAPLFPVVIDAPNQQGQDAVHLPQILKFIFERAPDNSQVIVAAEEAGADLPEGVEVHSFGERQRQVLREAEFAAVRDAFVHYTRQMV